MDVIKGLKDKMMTVQEIREALAANRQLLDGLDVATLSVFGSVARATAKPCSDVDILVDFRGPATITRFALLQERLEKLLGIKVDLVTRKGLRPELKTSIEDEAIRVA